MAQLHSGLEDLGQSVGSSLQSGVVGLALGQLLDQFPDLTVEVDLVLLLRFHVLGVLGPPRFQVRNGVGEDEEAVPHLRLTDTALHHQSARLTVLYAMRLFERFVAFQTLFEIDFHWKHREKSAVGVSLRCRGEVDGAGGGGGRGRRGRPEDGEDEDEDEDEDEVDREGHVVAKHSYGGNE